MTRRSIWLVMIAALALAPAVGAGDDDDDKMPPKAEAPASAPKTPPPTDVEPAPHKAKDETKKDAKGDDDDAKGEQYPAVVVTQSLKAAAEAAKAEGTATILAPDTLTQLDGEIRAARIAAEYSKAQLTRAETLFKDKITVARQEMETAARQSAADALQLSLLEQRLHTAFGEGAPVYDKDKRQDLAAKLAKGEMQFVRIDFPGLSTQALHGLKMLPFNGGAAIAIDTMWPAPQASQAVPGLGFIALVSGGHGLSPGDRARVTAETGDTKSGVIIPNTAIVVTEGRAWCYIEKKPQKFVRRPVSLENPNEGGYLVRAGFTEGEKVVVKGAGHLLAREADPGTADDND